MSVAVELGGRRPREPVLELLFESEISEKVAQSVAGGVDGHSVCAWCSLVQFGGGLQSNRDRKTECTKLRHQDAVDGVHGASIANEQTLYRIDGYAHSSRLRAIGWLVAVDPRRALAARHARRKRMYMIHKSR